MQTIHEGNRIAGIRAPISFPSGRDFKTGGVRSSMFSLNPMSPSLRFKCCLTIGIRVPVGCPSRSVQRLVSQMTKHSSPARQMAPIPQYDTVLAWAIFISSDMFFVPIC